MRYRVLPPLGVSMVILGAASIILTTSGRAGPVLVSLGGGHGIHMYDVGLVLIAGVAVVIVWRGLRRLAKP